MFGEGFCDRTEDDETRIAEYGNSGGATRNAQGFGSFAFADNIQYIRGDSHRGARFLHDGSDDAACNYDDADALH